MFQVLTRFLYAIKVPVLIIPKLFSNFWRRQQRIPVTDLEMVKYALDMMYVMAEGGEGIGSSISCA